MFTGGIKTIIEVHDLEDQSLNGQPIKHFLRAWLPWATENEQARERSGALTSSGVQMDAERTKMLTDLWDQLSANFPLDQTYRLKTLSTLHDLFNKYKCKGKPKEQKNIRKRKKRTSKKGLSNDTLPNLIGKAFTF